MSASSKKQQRKAEEEAVIASREQEEQTKAAQRKRNTLIYSIIGVVVVILAAILLIWDSGVFQRNTTAVTIDGEEYTPAQVAYYYYENGVILNAQTYAMYGLTGFPYSLNESPKDQIITEDAVTNLGISREWLNKTYHEYFLDYALNSLREEMAMVKAANAAGYTLSEEGRALIEQELASLDSAREQYLVTYGADLSRTKFLQMSYGNTMTEKVYRQCMENTQLASEFYNQHFEEIANYTAEELDAYYQANTTTFETITYYWRQFTAEVVTAEGETPTPEQTAAALSIAQSSAAAELALVQADPDMVKENADYTKATGVLSNPEAFYYDWMTDPARQSGDATVLEGSEGTDYYLLVFEDRFRDETPTVDVRHILVEAKNEDDPATTDVNESTEEPTEEAYAAAKEKAEALLAQWKAGEATEESFAALVAENSADAGSNTNGGLYESVVQGSMIDTFNDWIFDEARQSGDTGIVQNTQSTTKGWHIIYFVDHAEPIWVTHVRQAKWSEDLENSVEIIPTDKLDLVVN